MAADIKSQTAEELQAQFREWGEPAYRVAQLFKWLYVHRATEWEGMTNLPKALRALDVMNGVTREVSDDEILEHRALVARYGFGCEPASAASVAGLRKLLADQTISADERVVCVLTGHELKDPNATVKYHTGIDMKAAQETAPRGPVNGRLSNQPVQVEDDLNAIVKALGLS